MKKIFSAILLCAVGMAAHASQASKAPALKNSSDSLGYYLGATQGVAYNNSIREQATPEQYKSVRAAYLRGMQAALDADTSATAFYDGFNAGRSIVEAMKEMKSNGYPVNLAMFRKAFTDNFMTNGVTEEEFNSLMSQLNELMKPIAANIEQRRKDAQKAELSKAEQLSYDNREAGKRYIDSLKRANDGYVETPSGLVYKITRRGEGENLTAAKKANVRYTGKFVNGKVFDSSGERTVTFGPSDVIKGFGEGMQLLNKGAKATLVIPADIAYGDKAPAVIGPGQTLIFEIEIVDILP